jgi:hypothetical protein
MINRINKRVIIAAGFLLVAAASVEGMIALLQIVLHKEEAPLRHKLELMPGRMGPYIVEQKQDRLSEELESVLGTKDYVSWFMRDTRRDPGEPGAIIRMHVPYYTGMVDTVPHVPDRCFVGGAGASVANSTLIDIELDGPEIQVRPDGQVLGTTQRGIQTKLPGRRFTLSVVTFADRQEDRTYCVAYFFIANNKFVATPQDVRAQAFNAFDRYAYYCKIEVLPGSLQAVNGQNVFVSNISDPQQTAEIVADFLVYALPEVMYCLPDWEALNAEPGQPTGSRGEDR